MPTSSLPEYKNTQDCYVIFNFQFYMGKNGDGINITIPNIIYSKQGLETLLLNETFIKKKTGISVSYCLLVAD
jgi:hypothetical protein